jgi:glucose-1-phosphate adenylyltransferase
MDYGNMLAKHKESGAGISRAVIPAHYSDSDTDMGIYIFNWNVLMDFLKTYRDDIGADINSCIPGYAGENNVYVNIYEYNGYWKNLPDIGAYWEDCMELTSIVPEFNLYEDYWKIYTRSESQTPQYIAETAQTEQCIIGDDTDICGSVYNSVIGYGVTIAAGATVSNSIIMNNTYIGADSRIDMTVIGEDTKVGSNVRIGVNDAGTFDIQYKERAAERTWDNLSARITTIGEKSVIPDNVSIAAGAAVSGVTESTDYADSVLGSGMTLIKAGERS